MKNKLMVLILIILFAIYVYPQTDSVTNASNIEVKRILRSYITAGYGRTINEKNWAIGVGWFFPLSENILIGPRANANFELDAFPVKDPSEYIWDIDLVIKYIPFISERIIFSIGAGAGYSWATKRGEFIGYNLVTAEYKKVHSSSLSLLGEVEADLLITDNFGVNIVCYTLHADNRMFVNYELGLFLCKILELH